LTTHIGVERVGGQHRYTLRGAALTPRVLPSVGDTARVALVASRALLLAGDAVSVDVIVGAGTDVEIVETSGTVAYDARGGTASWTVRCEVREGGRLTWRGLPFVVAAGADVTRTNTIAVAAGATARMRETLVFGRTGETGGSLFGRTRVTLAGEILLAEDLDLTPTARRRPGILAGHRCLDTLLVAGERLPFDAIKGVHPHQVMQLAGLGTLVRFVGAHLHESPLDTVVATSERNRTVITGQ
jgi:urease accessory protein